MEAIQSRPAATDLSTEDGTLRYSNRVLYALWALFAVIMILVAIRDYARSGGPQLWKPLVWEGSSMIFATVLLILQRTVARPVYARWLGEPLKWFWNHLKWFPLSVLAFLLLVFGARSGVYGLVGQTYTHDPWPALVPYEAAKLLLFTGLWLGVIFGFDSFARWHAQQRQLLDLERALAESRLAALSLQLQPHFFFNALNTISALMHMDVARADRLLARLADLLRASLQSGERQLVPLVEELRVLDLYVQIMLERFADRVVVQWRIDDALLRSQVPAMLMQPLVENAFQHAVERGRESVRIEIGAASEDGKLVLSVRNTGSSLPAGWHEGVGMRNCRERLYVMYGAAASVRLGEGAAGVEAVVILPIAGVRT